MESWSSMQYANPGLLKKLSAPTEDETDADLDGMILDTCFEHRTQIVGRGIEWIMTNPIELQAGQVVDRLIGARNPARERAKRISETQSPRKMATTLQRFCDNNNGQRPGYTIQRRKEKDEHYVYIFDRIAVPASNGSTPPLSNTSLASLASKFKGRS
jgi:hypothetical protein